MFIFSLQFSFTYKIIPTSFPSQLQNFCKFYIMTETCLFTCFTNMGKPTYSLTFPCTIYLFQIFCSQTTHTAVLSSSHLRFNSFFKNVNTFIYNKTAILVIIRTSIMSYNCHLFSVVGIIKMQSLSKSDIIIQYCYPYSLYCPKIQFLQVFAQ